ncbi:SirB2 family protein [Colwellia sp. PAMC 21821]|uniref:SirB2 family protein n=1 Tax=Colwellia sp. PAMC 21821 TaxID=1816219 RepID=UPI0009C18B5B|nr:SirB2 family protein [Colwellia sp. PAMC 21821]ARD43279.1 SirB family protein [Colwellia sp. PAMC 21821]
MLKHLHMTVAVISILLFTFRFALTLANSNKLSLKWLKIAPHIIDTLLLGLGIALAIKLSINPGEQLWLAEKILAVFAYIFTGYYTLKLARNRTMQIIGFLGAIGWIMLIVRIAISKETVFLAGL